MPELPEVETVRASLQPFVCNQVITGIRIYWSSVIKQPDLVSFRKLIVGQKILDLKRKAKHLIFELEDFVLISHLRMEGKYYYQNLNDNIEWKHVLLVLELSNGCELRYHDTRRFGTFHLQKKDEYEQLAPLIKVGPEPFESRATVDYLQKKFKNKNRAIKTMLLDQSIISGLGNIYVDEVLFASKIHPVTRCNKLETEHLKAILNNAKQILTQAINLKGTTIASYTSNVGVKGTYQQLLKVHTREALACYVCSSIIEKIKLNGRGTYFCCQCQNKL
ncbi:DNA-formamidopyrimidine glycosylase [Spiroplasma endosymbiont of Nephrotoma flavescens]|uniref:DNA-formamidopyrimidine glycosylase n=1 Tax=Spiroplasma endosymbiont of Nephrotoma flavescens TaxID=3066302 RepID=UPI00313EEE0A